MIKILSSKSLISLMTDQRCNSALGEENEEDVEGMKQHKGSSSKTVNSTRNALRMARKRPLEALLTGWVVNQKLANPERHLDVAKGHSQHADDRTDELKRLNRSIFRPVITFNKDAKRAAQEAKVLQRYEEEREEREKATRDSKSLGSGVDLRLPGGGNRGGAKCGASRCRSTVAKRYQVEAAASDDEPEDELDNNLDNFRRGKDAHPFKL
ncbi:hypothetical protein EDB84DRAFT_1673368 [Lactarius hengduanensis]|nr:hypothetical protein EDB84DRAFT_1673368 [Lactarius hengduanensis]